MSKVKNLILAAICGALLSLAPASVAASAPIATYSSPGCPSEVATWRIAYRMYWSSTVGQTTTHEALPAALEQLARFADDVSTDSACGVRVTIDVYDEGSAQWPASTESRQLPAESEAFEAAGHYDWIFYRFPANGEPYCANTGTTGGPAEGTLPSISRYPVDPEGHLGCAAGPASTDCKCEPWRTLMEHEWLHAVVAFYNPRLGWPTPDVHGACEHGYSPGPCPSGMTNETYFADLMQGKVPEAGTLRGIQPDEWTRQGTPANPLIHSPPLSIGAGKDGKFAVRFPADLGGPVQLSISRPSGQVADEASVAAPGSEFAVPGKGRWEVCLAFAGSERYYKGSTCSPWSLVTVKACDMQPRRGRHQLPLRITHSGRRYRIVAVGVPAGCDATLIVRHGKRKRRIQGQRRQGNLIFHLTTRGPKPWRVVLRINEGNGRFVTSRHYALPPA